MFDIVCSLARPEFPIDAHPDISKYNIVNQKPRIMLRSIDFAISLRATGVLGHLSHSAACAISLDRASSVMKKVRKQPHSLQASALPLFLQQEEEVGRAQTVKPLWRQRAAAGAYGADGNHSRHSH
jgi:hypothetical protein